MRFLFLVCVDPAITPDDSPAEVEAWVQRAGAGRSDGGPLRAPRTAVTVRIRDGRVVTTDGAVPTTGEYIAGFDVIECASREAAVELATAHPVARFGAIEVRELID